MSHLLDNSTTSIETSVKTTSISEELNAPSFLKTLSTSKPKTGRKTKKLQSHSKSSRKQAAKRIFLR